MTLPTLSTITLDQEVGYLQEHVNLITSQIYKAEQLDLLQLSLINLLDMVKDEEIDLILSQPNKSLAQKKLFLEKIIATVHSKELYQLLETALKQNHMEFFQGKYLGALLRQLRAWDEQFKVIKLAVALDFEDSDLRVMAALLSQKVQHPVALEIKVDKSLIGGAVIQYGSFISDYSIKTQLDMVRSSWKKAVLDQNLGKA